MIILKARATGTGRVVDYSKFKKGQMVNKSRMSLGWTTVLTDAVTAMLSACEKLDPNFKIEMILPNSWNTTSMDFAIHGQGYTVSCARRLVRGGFPLNFLAAEFGKNYDVIFTIDSHSKETEELLTMAITKLCPTEIMS